VGSHGGWVRVGSHGVGEGGVPWRVGEGGVPWRVGEGGTSETTMPNEKMSAERSTWPRITSGAMCDMVPRAEPLTRVWSRGLASPKSAILTTPCATSQEEWGREDQGW
jgi:hypothetical protein